MLQEKIISELKNVYDPEIPINIVDFGLVQSVEVENFGRVKIEVVLTSAVCPFKRQLIRSIMRSAGNVEGVEEVKVEVDSGRSWNPRMASERGQKELKEMGMIGGDGDSWFRGG